MRALLKGVYGEFVIPAFWVLFSLAVIILGIMVISCIRKAGDDKGSESCRGLIWWLVGMFIMASAVGIVQVMVDTINSAGGTPIENPFDWLL